VSVKFELTTSKWVQENPTPAHTGPSLSNKVGYAVDPAADTLKSLLESLFIWSWDIYLQAKDELARLLTLK
jgi:hypothetical protein